MTGRFAPSPTGELHLGSLVAAMASFLDARARGQQWLVRIEDVDTPRTVPGAAQAIIDTLDDLGMCSDAPVVYQSKRLDLYSQAFNQLLSQGQVFACRCSRRELEDLGIARYPGTCRDLELGKQTTDQALAWRVRVPDPAILWTDRWLGPQVDNLKVTSGDFVVLRKDRVWAYQLAVVVDDHAQGVTNVVRGADLLDSTARQIHLQRLLGIPEPAYMHVPLVLAEDGNKLSKQNGATPVAHYWQGAAQVLEAKLAVLNTSLETLMLTKVQAGSLDEFWRQAVALWAQRWPEQNSVTKAPKQGAD